MGKQRRVELKSVGNFVAKTVLVESANHISLEELCMTQYSMKYFFRSHVDHQTYGKTLKFWYTSNNFVALAYFTLYQDEQVVKLMRMKHNQVLTYNLTIIS